MTKRARTEKQRDTSERNPVLDVIKQTPGFAASTRSRVEPRAGDTYIYMKQSMQAVEKRRLAQYVVEKYIADLTSVALDAGSTQQQIVESMMESRNFLSILTNNMTAFRQNSTQGVERSANEFILTGGKYVASFDALLGHETYTSFDYFNPNVVVIGASGIVAEQGFFCHGNDEVDIKKLLFAKNAATVVIPVDHTKLGRSDAYLFGETHRFRGRPGVNCVLVVCPPLLTDTSRDQESTMRARIYEGQVRKLRELDVNVDEVPPE